MTTIPGGKWSHLLVEHVWPDDGALAAIQVSRGHREIIQSGYQEFSETLGRAVHTALSEQQGVTAINLRQAFLQGEEQSRRLAQKNAAKAAAYAAAHASASDLQRGLYQLAKQGNSEIEDIEKSNEEAEIKLGKIVAKVAEYQRQANIKAANCASNILDAVQQILNQEGREESAHQFSQALGIDPRRLSKQPDDQLIEQQARDVMTVPGSTASLTSNLDMASNDPQNGPHTKPNYADTSSLTNNLAVATPPVQRPHAAATPNETISLTGNLTGTANAGVTGPALVSRPTTPSVTYAAPSALPSPSSAPTPIAALPSNNSVSGARPLASLPHTPTITPTELAQSFNKGMESGAPFSVAAHAASPIPVTSTEPQISHAAQTIPSAAPTPQVHVPVVDSPQPVHHVTAAETPPPTPIVAAAQPISPPVTPQAVGPLPTYGSDLRPPAATTMIPTQPHSTPLPPSATPSSAPVTPSSGHSSANQPALVRQTASSAPPPPPPTQGTQAVAATATGAAIGTASADATARKRLQRLVNTVARQQPRLAWAAGDRADNTTVLVTDLASGWIPPGIDLPSAVTLLPPARRRGNVEVLLGDVTVTASYTPTHHLADDGEQTPTSPRPRSVPDVSDLGWELSQATQWRDGLPRLAHTLAKAVSAGTGVLDSEIDLLHEHLAETSKRVLDEYPNHIDTHDVGNWQLLAALDALVVGDKATANYHLAWFVAAKAG